MASNQEVELLRKIAVQASLTVQNTLWRELRPGQYELAELLEKAGYLEKRIVMVAKTTHACVPDRKAK